MRLIYSIEELASIPGPLVLAMGVFDGLHLGHQAVLHAALDKAKHLRGTAVSLTFDPHPTTVLRPHNAPRLLTSTPHKLRLMEEVGIENVLIVRFDKAFAAIEPEDFIARLSVAARSLAHVCVGAGWRFGRARRGDGILLKSLGTLHQFTTTEVPPVILDDQVVSSTIIRKAIEEGDLEKARKFLGRPYSILGTVKRGDRLGSQIGFPTANLSAHNEQYPPNGVYVAKTKIAGQLFDSVANIGFRPTVSSSGIRAFEVHILDFHGDLYEQDIEVTFLSLLRSEKKFPNLEELRAQIADDVKNAREVLASKE